MIGEIKVGYPIKCLECGKVFKLEKIRLDECAEYIDCPHCHCSKDVQVYHLHGQRLTCIGEPFDIKKIVDAAYEKAKIKECINAMRMVYVEMIETGFTAKEAMNYLVAMSRPPREDE
jgi:DNA-directed RNA polymerase subunit RPC12/RpoP